MLKRLCSIFVAAAFAASMWIWVQRIAIPHQQDESAARGTPRGNLSDLYPRWLGARELLLHRRNPYSPGITREIQAGYYGRPLDPNRPNDPKDQQAFAYPVYVVYLLAPTVELPFPIVQRAFFWFFILITAGSVLLWMQALGWRPSLTTKLIWILLALGSFPVIQGIKLQQLSVLVAALIAAAMHSLARRRLIWAGMFLALATIKPQLAALPILWLCIWVLGDFRRRQRALWSLAATSAVLVIVGEILLPGWIAQFRAALTAYYQYTGGGKSVLDVALTPLWGRIASGILIAAFLLVVWRVRQADEHSSEFQWSFSLALAVTLAVIPMFAPYNQLLLMPALMIFVRSLPALWSKNLLSRFLLAAAVIAVVFPWIAAVSLTAALLFLPATMLQKAWAIPIYTTFAIPVTTLALLLVARSLPPHAPPRPPALRHT